MRQSEQVSGSIQCSLVLEGVQDLGERTLLHALIGTRIDVPEGSMASELLEAVVPHLLALARAAVDDRPHTPADLGLTIDPPCLWDRPCVGPHGGQSHNGGAGGGRPAYAVRRTPRWCRGHYSEKLVRGQVDWKDKAIVGDSKLRSG